MKIQTFSIAISLTQHVKRGPPSRTPWFYTRLSPGDKQIESVVGNGVMEYDIHLEITAHCRYQSEKSIMMIMVICSLEDRRPVFANVDCPTETYDFIYY